MKSSKTRSYNMQARAESAAVNSRRILEITIDLWRKLPFHEITLDEIAARSGMSVRTILRKHNSKESLFEACIEYETENITSFRDQVPTGDVENAIRVLLEDYEKNGEGNIRTLALEETLSIAHKLLETGRKHHREWCARVFAPFLPEPSASIYSSRLDAFYAATEVYLWKLFRKDLHRSLEETREIFRVLLNSLIANHDIEGK